jgi:hypothetical protein
MQDFQCDLSNVFLDEGFDNFEMHPNSFDFLKCDLSNVFLNGGVESLMVFPPSSYYFLIAITPCLFLNLLQISNIDCISLDLYLSRSMPLVVDHFIRVVVVSSYDQPIITCTSLGKSTNTTPIASIGKCC